MSKDAYKVIIAVETVAIIVLLYLLSDCHRGLQGFAGRLTGHGW